MGLDVVEYDCDEKSGASLPSVELSALLRLAGKYILTCFQPIYRN